MIKIVIVPLANLSSAGRRWKVNNAGKGIFDAVSTATTVNCEPHCRA